MPQPVRPFEHQDSERKSDETLRQEARMRLGATPPLQLVAELLSKLRGLDLPWWTPELLRSRWSATDRLRWYRARPDLRQQITTMLTGLAPKAARKKAPDFQASLIDSVLDEGDVNPVSFETAFDPCDLVVYGPVDTFWSAFIERMPWGQDIPIHQELIAWLFDALLSDHSPIDGMSRRPILTPWDARTAIDGRVWHTRMPLEIRVAIDDARFQKERDRPTEPFHAESDLAIAIAQTIATNIPLRDLAPVFSAAERAMGFPPTPRPGPHNEPGRSPPELIPAPKPSPNPAAVRAELAPKADAPAEVRPAARQNSPSSPPAQIEGTSVASKASKSAPPPMPAVPPMPPAAPPSQTPPPAIASTSSPSLQAAQQALIQRSMTPQPAPPPPLRRSEHPPQPSAMPPGPRRNEPPPFQGGPPPFQGGPPPAQGGPPPFQGNPPPFQGGPPPFQGGGTGTTPMPLERQTGSSRYEPPPQDRPSGSGRFELPLQGKGAPSRPSGRADAPPNAPPPDGNYASFAGLLEELDDVPAEEDRTNPWDVDEDGPPDEVTGAQLGRRELGDTAKRRRSGKI